MVTKDDKPYLVFGVMGGDFQAAGARAGAGEHDRLRHERAGSRRGPAHRARRLADADGQSPAIRKGGPDQSRTRHPAAVLRELERRGHQVGTVTTNGGGYQAILIDPRTGMLHGGSEARKDGCAAGVLRSASSNRRERRTIRT